MECGEPMTAFVLSYGSHSFSSWLYICWRRNWRIADSSTNSAVLVTQIFLTLTPLTIKMLMFCYKLSSQIPLCLQKKLAENLQSVLSRSGAIASVFFKPVLQRTLFFTNSAFSETYFCVGRKEARIICLLNKHQDSLPSKLALKWVQCFISYENLGNFYCIFKL